MRAGHATAAALLIAIAAGGTADESPPVSFSGGLRVTPEEWPLCQLGAFAPEQRVLVAGSGFASGEGVRLTLNQLTRVHDLGSETADTAGNLARVVRVPRAVVLSEPGIFEAESENGGLRASSIALSFNASRSLLADDFCGSQGTGEVRGAR